MRQLTHNGVLVPKSYEAKGFSIYLRGHRVNLTPEQEEMAVAWVKKMGTDYVKDGRFARNFFRDFGEALGIRERVSPTDFDFSEIVRHVEAERSARLSLSGEERKRLAEERRAIREANKERYGYAVVDGVRVEVGNYVVEPPAIFMGRGRHPLRGRWKPRVAENDVTLNLSPDAPVPPGGWKEIVWQPDAMWVAKWQDKLSGETKYIWLADSARIKQQREVEKFDRARELEARIEDVRVHIAASLQAEDVRRRRIATVCYLIDTLKLRVGDEKERDEADTVGATTLRPGHIAFGAGGLVTFDFLGKDSVRWRKEVTLPETVVKNLQGFISESRSSVFRGVTSESVSLFLNEAMPGLTAKVFRTYHASNAARDYLRNAKASAGDPEYVKRYAATMANLQAAVICNHKRKLPRTWRQSLARKMERLGKLRERRSGKAGEAIRVLRTRIKAMKATRDYNLGTSLKSYIDPRVYYDWGKSVCFDWKLYYPKSLQRKFSWVESSPTRSSVGETKGLS